MAIAAVFALIFTLAGELAPKHVKPWIPSPTGFGLAFILPASNSYTFLVGALVAEYAGRKWPLKNRNGSAVGEADGRRPAAKRRAER